MSEYANNNEGYELNWDSAIEKDSPEYILLPEGDYDFTVTKFERGRHNGSEKLPALQQGHNPSSHRNAPGKRRHTAPAFSPLKDGGNALGLFYRHRPKEKGREDHHELERRDPGAKGRCRVYVDTWKGSDGEERKSNRVRRFYEPEEAKETKPAGFTPGRF